MDENSSVKNIKTQNLGVIFGNPKLGSEKYFIESKFENRGKGIKMMIRNNNKDVKNTKETNNIKDTNTKEFIVVKDSGLYTEEIYYAGNNEVEAFKNYKRIKGGKKNIFIANIKRDLVFGVPFIDTYEILEVIK